MTFGGSHQALSGKWQLISAEGTLFAAADAEFEITLSTAGEGVMSAGFPSPFLSHRPFPSVTFQPYRVAPARNGTAAGPERFPVDAAAGG
ncbi:hypothetical protein ACQEU8_01450 [Streptomyces sp. CA-250714]|uniref:hypothetical protein n=1 Tax=Streptomyces sp. CA-250714 TaxID=3240060 RepID=UPI003D94DCF5